MTGRFSDVCASSVTVTVRGLRKPKSEFQRPAKRSADNSKGFRSCAGGRQVTCQFEHLVFAFASNSGLFQYLANDQFGSCSALTVLSSLLQESTCLVVAVRGLSKLSSCLYSAPGMINNAACPAVRLFHQQPCLYIAKSLPGCNPYSLRAPQDIHTLSFCDLQAFSSVIYSEVWYPLCCYSMIAWSEASQR